MSGTQEFGPVASLGRSCTFVFCMALGGLALESRPVQASQAVVQSENEVERVVREWREQRDASTAPALRKLSALGRASDAALLAQAVKECTSGTPAAQTCELLAQALSAVPRERLRALTLARVQLGLGRSESELLLAAFGRAGLGADLDLCLKLATSKPAELDDPEPILVALRIAVQDIANRDRVIWDQAQRLLVQQGPEVQHALVAAAGDRARLPAAGDQAALRFLGWCFASLHAARLEALNEIQRVSTVVSEADEDLLRTLRDSLDGQSSGVQPDDTLADVALVLGRFEDAESVTSLIELLDDRRPGVRENAHWSLQRISGLHLVPEAERWRRWHAEELSWWQSEWPNQFLRLQSGDTTAVRLAILELGRHRFRRERLARAVADTLAGADRELVQLACAVLSQLGSRAATPALIAVLEHPELDARESAWNCLKTLTRLELPLDPAAWRELFART